MPSPQGGREDGLGADNTHPRPTAMTAACTVCPVSGQKNAGLWVLGAITVLGREGLADWPIVLSIRL